MNFIQARHVIGDCQRRDAATVVSREGHCRRVVLDRGRAASMTSPSKNQGIRQQPNRNPVHPQRWWHFTGMLTGYRVRTRLLR